MIPVLNEKFSVSKEVSDFFNELKSEKNFTGEIALDDGERLIQSTDNSIYQVIPKAVVYPKTTEDVSVMMKIMSKPEYDSVRISPRGAGTGTNGQALNDCIIVDTSKYMKKILEVNLNEGYAVVQPGVVLDQFNEVLGKEGYFFAPMVSTSSRATLGGMCANDSSGIGSLLYGKTSNHLIDVKMVLSDGTVYDSRSLSESDLSKRVSQNDIVSKILDTVKNIVTQKRDLIEKTFPKLNRFMTGYNLFHALEENGNINLNYIVSGSEGTLSLFTEMKVRIMKKPTFEKVVICKFKSFEDGLRSANYVVRHNPTGIETIDGNIVSLAREDNIWHDVSQFFSDPGDEEVQCVNYVQFTGHTQAEVDEKVKKLVEELNDRKGKPRDLNSFLVAEDKDDLNALWNMRKKGVGLLGNKPGERRPQAFVEDTAVAPEVLADFIMEFCSILDSYQLDYGMFGHIDAGCLHVRPALDLKQTEDKKLMREISDQIKDLSIKYKGVLWGEHGKGFRGEYLPDFFGPELYEDLRKIKAAFDPKNKFNPGKFCTPYGSDEKVTLIDEAGFRGDFDKEIPPGIKNSYEVALNCNGNGACFNYSPNDVMCPSYRQSGSRVHSPKGRASLMREWLRQISNSGYDPTLIASEKYAAARPSNNLKDGSDFSHIVYESMKECLSCKACSSQCPVKVDIPELKAKFLNHYHTRYKRSKRDYLIKNTESLHAALSKFPAIYNLPLKIAGANKMIELMTGMVDPPLLSTPSLSSRLKSLNVGKLDELGRLSPLEKEKSVILVQDPLTSLYEADLVCDVVQFLDKIGIKVFVLPLLENGKAKHVKGFLREFKETAEKSSQVISSYSKHDVPLICIEPAIALTYREEYQKYVSKENLGYKVQMLQEYLANRKDLDKLIFEVDSSVKPALFGHCGEKTSSPSYAKQWIKVFSSFGLDLGVQSVGCCGMAGAYGHEKEHKKSSIEIFNIHWKNKWESVKANSFVPLVTGASCRSQVKRIEGLKPLHPVSFLNRSIKA